MHRYDYFSGATWDWRTRVAMRMRQVLDDHPGDALVYIEKCIRRAHWASFEKRHWRQIRPIIASLALRHRYRLNSFVTPPCH